MFQLLRKKVNQLINSQIPIELILSECQFRRLLALYEVVAPDAVWQDAITKAINRIIGQLALDSPCGCKKVSVLLYKNDIEALKRLVNNHCTGIAEFYAEAEGMIAFIAEKQYEAYTNLMLRLK